MLTLISFLVAIGIIALVHEFGHFITAKKNGIYVKEFAIGFGPKVFGIKKGETEYNIRLLPIAGFVDLAGMDPDEELEEQYKDRGFSSKTPMVKALILVAGAAMNIILAIFLFTFVYWIKGAPKEIKPIIGEVLKDSPAAKAGLKPGDVVLSITYDDKGTQKEKKVRTFLDIIFVVATHPNKKIVFKIRREGKILDIPVVPKPDPDRNNLGEVGISPRFIPPVIGGVVEGGPAAKTGLKKGDRILKINGKDIDSWFQLENAIKSSKGMTLEIEVKRSNEILTFQVKPKKYTEKELEGFFTKLRKFFWKGETKKKGQGEDKESLKELKEKYILGIVSESYKPERIKVSLPQAFIRAVKRVYQISIDMLTGLYYLFTNRIPGGFKNTVGPVGIASFTGERAKAGIWIFLEWVALLSTYIGLFNLIPFPALDGGRLFFVILGKVIGREIPPKIEEKFHTVGFVLLLGLMIYVTFNDVGRIFKGGKSK